MRFQRKSSSKEKEEPREIECEPFSRTYTLVTSIIVCCFVFGFDYVLLKREWPFFGWWKGETSRALNPNDWFLLLFMAPFNFVAILIPFAPLFNWVERLRPLPFNYQSDRFEPVEIVRLGPGLVGGFLVSFFLACFAGAILAAFANLLNLPVTEFMFVMVLQLIDTIIGGIFIHVRAKSGRYDLILHDGKNAVSLPPIGSRDRFEVPYHDIARFRIRHFTTTDEQGESSRSTHLILERKNDSPVVVQENLWISKGDGLAEWLNEKLRLPNARKI